MAWKFCEAFLDSETIWLSKEKTWLKLIPNSFRMEPIGIVLFLTFNEIISPLFIKI